MAEASADRLEKHMQQINMAEVRADMLACATQENQNNWQAARQDFVHAYSLDPANAFTLNNLGYVSEREGDLETAQFFYTKARRASNANRPIGKATNAAAQGQPLVRVAEDSDGKVDSKLEQYSQQRRVEQGPVELAPRGDDSNAPTTSPNNPQ